ICNAPVFHGIALSDGGPVFFKSAPVDRTYMEACVNRSLQTIISAEGEMESESSDIVEESPTNMTIEDRLVMLMQQRQKHIQPIALATMKVWRGEKLMSESEDTFFL